MTQSKTGGPGWHRMKARLGPVGMEEMRQRVLREKEEALARVGQGPATQPRPDVPDYPPTRPPRRHK